MKNEKSQRKWLEWLCFAIYLGFLLYIVFFADRPAGTDPGRFYRYNLIPFREIRRYIHNFHFLGIYAALNLAGNIVAFMPYGMFLPLLWKTAEKARNLILYSFVFSLMIETVQLVFRVGSFDVDDLMLNTLGGAIGYLLYWLIIRKRKNKKQNLNNRKRNQEKNESKTAPVSTDGE